MEKAIAKRLSYALAESDVKCPIIELGTVFFTKVPPLENTQVYLDIFYSLS